MRKTLPQGSWFSFCGLHPNTTNEDLQSALAEAGVELDVDRISITNDGTQRSSYAVISLSRADVQKLLARALLNDDGLPVKLFGRSLSPLIPRNANPDW